MKRTATLLVVGAALALAVAPLSAQVKTPPAVQADHGMVASVRPEASQAGVEILKRGGNAVDAAVATAFALAVTYPEAGNIGGGGFMIVHPGGGQEPVCIEYRETAPAASTPEMFQLGESRHTHKIVGTPGTVRGLALAHEKFGKLPWKDLVLPAVKLAREGFVLDKPLADSLNALVKESTDFAELRRVFGKAGGKEDWRPGDRLKQPDLADTLALIARDGPDAFYSGKIADQLVAEMKSGTGLITKADLAAYRAQVRPPIHGTFRGYDVYGPPPPSSGGIVLVEMLNMLETFNLREQDRFAAETLHVMIEAMKRAYRDRARHLGDADFVKIPGHLTTKEYARKLAEQIDLKQATPSAKLAGDIKLVRESESTTHFSVVDEAGMAVSNTYTLEHAFGSRIVVRGAGFLLNNEMGDFNWKPGHTDRQGRIGTPANVIAPGKRMLSSQTPVIVAKEGEVYLVTGSPGGRTIINTLLNVVLNVLEFEMDLPEAIAAPRLHHQWFPDLVRFEGLKQPAHAETIKKLRELGHDFYPAAPVQGDAHSILIAPQSGRRNGVADPRRLTGKAVGY